MAREVGGRSQPGHAETADGQGEAQEELSSGLVDHQGGDATSNHLN